METNFRRHCGSSDKRRTSKRSLRNLRSNVKLLQVGRVHCKSHQWQRKLEKILKKERDTMRCWLY